MPASRPTAIRTTWKAALVFCVLLDGFFAFGIIRSAFGFPADFGEYYVETATAVSGGWAAAFSASAQHATAVRLGLGPMGPVPQSPALVALVMPFTALPVDIAWPIWEAIMLASWLGAVVIARAGWKGVVMTMALIPVAVAIRMGQVSPLVALIVVTAAVCIRRERPLLGGGLLSLLAIKPQLAFMVPVTLIAAGRWKPLAAFAVCGLVGGAVLAAWMGLSGIESMIRMMQLAAHHPRLFGDADKYTVDSLGPPGVALAVRIVAASAAALAAWRNRSNINVILALGLAASPLLTTFNHFEDYAVVVFAPILAGPALLGRLRPYLLGLGAVAAEFVITKGGQMPFLWLTLGGLVAVALLPPQSTADAVDARDASRGDALTEESVRGLTVG
jgi:hypothetical protein